MTQPEDSFDVIPADMVSTCACGYPLVAVRDESGKRIGVTHANADQEDHHNAFWSGIALRPAQGKEGA